MKMKISHSSVFISFETKGKARQRPGCDTMAMMSFPSDSFSFSSSPREKLHIRFSTHRRDVKAGRKTVEALMGVYAFF